MRKEADVLEDVMLAVGGQDDCVVWRNSTGLAEHEKRKARYGLCVGSSDVIGLGPGGRFLAIECKRPGGKATEKQRKFLKLVKKYGGIAGVAESKEQALEIIEGARKVSLKDGA